jgi:hypothetical protein
LAQSHHLALQQRLVLLRLHQVALLRGVEGLQLRQLLLTALTARLDGMQLLLKAWGNTQARVCGMVWMIVYVPTYDD